MKGPKLFAVAVILGIILFPLGLLFSLCVNRKRFDSVLHRCAVTIDQSGNVFCSDLFNKVLLINAAGRYEFGNQDETISSALGKNYLKGCLSPVGMWLYNFLDKRDKDHSIKAIEHEP